MGRPKLKLLESYAPLLEAAGLGTFDALFGFEGGRNIDGHRDRNVVRFELPDRDGRPVVFYLKREWSPKPALLLREALARGLRPPLSRSRREYRNLVMLGRAGVATGEPVAVGEHRRGLGYHRALLLVREVPEAVNLDTYLHNFPPAPSAADLRVKRAVARETAVMVRRMHDAGLAFRDLWAKHVFVSPTLPHGSCRPTLIDAQRVRRFPQMMPRSRWHDLAALAATTDLPACSATDRLRFLLAYARQTRLTADVKLLWQRVAERATLLRGKGGDPKSALRRSGEPIDTAPLDREHFRYLDHHRLFLNTQYLSELERLGLGTFDDIMNYRGGKSYRNVPDRLTVRVPLVSPDGRETAVYLKRHQRVDRREWLLGLVRLRKPRTRAEVEYGNVFLLAQAGLASMTPVALGQDAKWGLRQRSFLMTLEIPGGRPADDYLKDAFASAARGEPLRRKRRLIAQIARLSRRFHGAGFHHRDFYLCHVFVRELPDAEGEAEWGLHLIDLQRVRRLGPGRVGRRWLVKDLAQMNYSAPAAIITRTDKVRFLREYLDLPARRRGERLGPDARQWMTDVAAKTARIAQHDRKIQSRHTVKP
jgi:heptose I phosphotransferase